MKSLLGSLAPSHSNRQRFSKSSRLVYETLEPRAMLTASGSVIISEIMYHPSSENILHEYLELNNTTDAAISLQGWEFTNGIDFTFSDISISPNDYLVVAADVASFQSVYPGVTNVVGGWTGKLSDRSDKLTLKDNFGQTINTLTYFDEGEWSQRERGPLDRGYEGWVWDDATDGEGYSLELRQRHLPNDRGSNWGSSTTLQGTPGVANSIAQANVAPLISDVSHFPIIPTSSDSVRISATVIDELATGINVEAYYRLDGTTSFTALTLFDDGLHDDGTAGDGVYAAQIPAQADGAIVEFYVQAADSSALVSTLPSAAQPANEQLTNLLYQVDDTFNVADPAGGSEFPAYRLIMTEAERAELETLSDNSASRRSNAQMNGTFISINGSTIENRYNVGIRNRGFGSRGELPHNFRINIPSDRTWQGIDKINLNTQFTQSQLAGLTLYGLTGYPAEDGKAVTMTVNGTNLSGPGSPSYGVYVQFEAADSDFVANHFPDDDDGNLYRVVRDSSNVVKGDLSVLADVDEYAIYYEKKTNETTSDHSDIIELVDKLNNTPDADYLAMLQSTVDVDNWLAYFAINAILNTDETSLATGDGDDYLIYRGVNDPRFKLIPHDFDTILGQGDTNATPIETIYRATDAAAIERFLLNPTILPQYHVKLYELLNSTFSKVQFDAVLHDRLDGFTPAATVGEMIDHMDARRAFILDLIDQSLTIENGAATINGYHRVTENHTAVFGTASKAQTQSVLVDGELADWDPVAGTWNLGISLGGESALIAKGSNWRYLDNGDVPSTSPEDDWRITPDPGWSQSGDAKLGYGDDGEITEVGFVTSDGDKNITTYFHKTFDVADADLVSGLTLNLLRDDGAIVFLNGVEVVRDNLPETGPITPTTEALSPVGGGEEDSFFSFTIDPLLLVTGQNILAVEIHQVSGTSSDIGFDAELVASLGSSSSIGGVALTPGVNRLTASAYSGPNGTGQLLESQSVFVWYDTGVSQTVVAQTITSDVLWSAADSPYIVTGDIIVGDGGTLTIEPGATVFFDNGTGLTVTGTGRISAQGTDEQRIHITYNPNNSNSWEGLRIVDTQTDNRFVYVDFVGGADQGAAVEVDTGKALFDHVSWSGSQEQVFDITHPRLVVSNSDIPAISGDETIYMSGMAIDEQLEFINNVIGFNSSGGDVVDISHSAPVSPTVIFRGNHFLGGDDDGIDTDGMRVIIEDNIFENFHYNTSRTTTSNAVSTGFVTVDGVAIASELYLTGNIFINNDHHVLLKDFSSVTMINNTLVDATVAAISLGEPNGSAVSGPGGSLVMDGNIVFGYPVFFEAQEPSTLVTIDRSLVSSAFVATGIGNVTGDPLFVDSFNRDFRLQSSSPALGTGPDGTNMGAVQDSLATENSLVISEINYNPYAPTAAEIDAGFIDNDLFEFIEIFNRSPVSAVNLTGLQFNDGISHIFGDIDLQPGQRAVVVKDLSAFELRYGNDVTVLGTYSGSLRNSGERVTLADAAGSEIVSVNYGQNDPWAFAADGDGSTLVLSDPSGTPQNQLGKYYAWRASVELGGTPGTDGVDPVEVVINEVFAHADVASFDFIELRNNSASDVNIGGWYLSDNAADLNQYQIPADTIITAGGYLVLDTIDFRNSDTAGNFELSNSGDVLFLTSGTGSEKTFVDSVSFAGTLEGVSLGRFPDATGRLNPLASRTPGTTNTPATTSPILISEINYHPGAPSLSALAIEPGLTESDLEFIELSNTLGTSISLSGWRVRGESDFDFTTETIASGQSLVLVSFDPSDPINTNRTLAFREHYGIDSSINLIGATTGGLSNSSGRVTLQRADVSNLIGTSWISVDEVVYDDLEPWPAADGTGAALHRIAANLNGALAASWTGDQPTPGTTSLQMFAPEVLASVRDNGATARPDLIDAISFVFDADVVVDKSHLELFNQTLGINVDVNVANVVFQYAPTTLTATWDVSSLNLAEAYFLATLSDAVTGRESNLALDGDNSQTAGGDHVQQLYVAIPGDANLDGDTDINDVNILSQTNTGDAAIVLKNIGSTGRVGWSTGDFNADGDVDRSSIDLLTQTESGDLAVLLANLGKNVSNFPQPEMALPVLSQPVISQPIISETFTVTPVSVQAISSPSEVAISAATAGSASIAKPKSRISSALKKTVPFAESQLPSFELAFTKKDVKESSLIASAAHSHPRGFDEFVKRKVSSLEQSPIQNDSTMALAGANKRLDDAFAEAFDFPLLQRSDEVIGFDGESVLLDQSIETETKNELTIGD